MTAKLKAQLSAVYFAMFLFVGIHMPFWPVWLQSKGITDSQIAVLTALSFALKIVFTPLVSHWVDSRGRKRLTIIALSFGLVVCLSSFCAVDGFTQILLLTIAAFACWSPIMALCESLTTIAAKHHGLDYGKIRLWGSVSFLVAAMASGALLGSFGAPALLWSIVGAAGLLFLAACWLPEAETDETHRRKASFRPFLHSRWFVLFIAATALIQGSHAVYYTFGTIYWRASGLSDDVIGVLWGASLASEIAFFAFGRPLVRRFGPVNVIILGGPPLRYVGQGSGRQAM